MSLTYLSISGAVFFDCPTGFVTESFEYFVVIAVFGKLVVAVHSQAGVDLGGDSPASPLPPLVVLSLLPRRHSSPRCHLPEIPIWLERIKRRHF